MNAIHERTTSGFPISIGTSLALESLFAPRQAPYDPSRIIPDDIDLGQYQEAWFNIHTLIRNILGAMKSEQAAVVSEKEVTNALVEEIGLIEDLFSIEGKGTCRPRFYELTYENILKDLNPAVRSRIKLRQANTVAQRHREALVKSVCEKVHELGDVWDGNLYFGDKPAHTNALVITHNPWDLLSYHNFNKLSLLESHTGVLKNRNRWGGKYFPVGTADMSLLPFNRRLLYIFGDRLMCSPSIPALRQQLVDIATRREWTPMTTVNKIMLDLELEIKEPLVYAFIRALPSK